MTVSVSGNLSTGLTGVCFVCGKGSRRSDEEALEEPVRKLGEELQEVRQLYEAEQDKTHSNEEELLQLHNQVATQLNN